MGSSSSTQEQQTDDVLDKSPPPYSEPLQQDGQHETSSEQPALPQPDAHSPATVPLPTNTPYPQLTYLSETSFQPDFYAFHRILVEIIAATFFTDRHLLNSAIAKHWLVWQTGMLIPVAELCALVHHLQSEVAVGRWLLVSEHEKKLLKLFVVKPVLCNSLDLVFVLEMLGRYECSDGSSGPESTLVKYYAGSDTDLADAILSHGRVLDRVVKWKDVRRVLDDAIANFHKNLGRDGLRNSRAVIQEAEKKSKRMCCWPVSDEYIQLGEVARKLSFWSSDEFEASRRRVIEAQRPSEPSEPREHRFLCPSCQFRYVGADVQH